MTTKKNQPDKKQQSRLSRFGDTSETIHDTWADMDMDIEIPDHIKNIFADKTEKKIQKDKD